jgi:hypothetical protein
MSTADCRGRLDKAFKGIAKDAEMTRRPIDPRHERTYGQIFTFKSVIERLNQQNALRVCSPNRDNGTGDL